MVRLKTARAFSLIEAAIVLGVVGLVIGGLWIAAASVNENRRMQELLTGSAQIIANMQAQYRNVDMAAQIAATAYCHDDPSIFRNVVGFKWNSMYDIQDPWGKPIACYFETFGFSIIYYELDKAACVRMVTYLGGRPDPGIIAVQTPHSFLNEWDLPYAPVDADCPTEANRISFNYKL